MGGMWVLRPLWMDTAAPVALLWAPVMPTTLTLQGDLKEVVGVFLEALFGLAGTGAGPGVAVVILLADGSQEVVVQEVSGRGQTQVPAEGLQEQQLRAQQFFLAEGEVLAAQDPGAVYLLQLGHVVFSVLEFTYRGGRAEVFGILTPSWMLQAHL